MFGPNEALSKQYNLKISKTVLRRSGTVPWQFEVPFSQETLQSHFPMVGPLTIVEERYLLLFSCMEHSRGATLHEHAVHCLDLNGGLRWSLPLEVEPVILEQKFPGTNHEAMPNTILFLHYFNSRFTYNATVNTGQPFVQILSVCSVQGYLKDRWLVLIPEPYKKYFNSQVSLYPGAKFVQENKNFLIDISVTNSQYPTGKVNFQIPVPYQ